MPNQNVNHVELADGTTIMDIRSTTATPGDVVQGATFYDRSGAQQTGTLGPFTGATGATGGSDGLVPAPAAGEQAKVLTGNGTWQVAPGARLIETSGTVTNTSGSYTGTFNNSDVTADQQAIQIELGTPSVFRSTISVTCGNGTVTVSCSDVVGESTIKIYSIKSATDAQAITSAEFDILDAGKQDKTDSNLTTTATTVVGAINEVNSKMLIDVVNSQTSLVSLISTMTDGETKKYWFADSTYLTDYPTELSSNGYTFYIQAVIEKRSDALATITIVGIHQNGMPASKKGEFISNVLYWEVSPAVLNGNLTQLSDQIAKITRIDCATLDSLKSQLISLAQSMAIGTCRNIMIVPSASFDVFTSGSGYSGYLWMTYNSNGQLYFSADVTNDYGTSVYIGYRYGTWYINSLSSRITTLNDQMATLYPPANGKYFGYVTFNGATYNLFINLGRNIINNYNIVASGSVEVVGISVKPVTSYATWQGCGINVEAENTVQANAGKGAFVSLAFTRKS